MKNKIIKAWGLFDFKFKLPLNKLNCYARYCETEYSIQPWAIFGKKKEALEIKRILKNDEGKLEVKKIEIKIIN